MKLLHTADWHLGLSLGGVSLLREQRAWAEELLAIARREEIGAVLIAGDVFDRAVASADAIALYDEILTRLARDEGIPVLLLAGNHDGAARLSSLGGLLRTAGVYLAGSLMERPMPIVIGDCAFWLLPYFNPEQVRLLYPEAGIKTAHDAMRALMDDIRARQDSTKRLIIGAHCFVTGASPAESDYGAQLGGAAQVGAEVFAGADYVALGHLHRAQEPAPRVRYSGAPYPYAFSEQGNSVTVFDTDAGEIRTVPLHPARTLRTLRGTYHEVLDAAEADARREDYMKIELTDRAAGLEVIDTLRAIYPNLLQILGAAPAGGLSDTLTVSELYDLAPRELLCRFCEEQGGEAPAPAQIETFLEALAHFSQGGEQQ